MGILSKFIITFLAGAVLMVVMSFSVYRKSYYYKKAMAEAGVSREKPGKRSLLVTLTLLVVMILFLAMFDLWIAHGEADSFTVLSGINLALVTLLSLFDAVFIDLFILMKWRPGFLHLPEGQPTSEAMVKHVRVQFTKGWIFKIPMALLAAGAASLAR